MSADVMAAACPRHRYLGRARLPGHRLAFTRRSVRTGTGVADVVAVDEAEVWGALYEIEEGDVDALDRKEGAGWAYERLGLRVYGDDGSAHEALAYIVLSKAAEEVRPSAEYAAQLIEAGRERGLPEGYVSALSTFLAALGA